MTKRPATFSLPQSPFDMKLFRNILIAILFYFSTITSFRNDVSANDFTETEYESHGVSKSDSISTSGKALSVKGKRVYKNYLKTSYELSNYELWLSSDDLYENGILYTKKAPLNEGCLQIDIDGDGLEDLFFYESYDLNVNPITNPPPNIFMNDGNVLNRKLWTGPSIKSPHGYLISGDFNNDSIPDIFAFEALDQPYDAEPSISKDFCHLLTNSPDGFKTVKEFDDQLGFWHTGCSGDIDNDGDLDVIMMNFFYWSNGVTSKILWNDGKGNFTYGTSGFSEIAPIQQSQLYDVNNDGYLDLVFSYLGNQLKATNDIIIMWGNGKEFNLSNSTSFVFPVNYYLWDIDFTDVDNDGIAEILLSFENVINGWANSTYLIDLYKSDDQGKTFVKKTDQYFDNNNVSYINKMRVKDIDNNGKMDIYTSDRKDYIRWEWNGSKFIRKLRPTILRDYVFTNTGKINLTWESETQDSVNNRRIKNWAIYSSDKGWDNTGQVSTPIIVPVSETKNGNSFDQWDIDATSKEMFVRISALDSVGNELSLSNMLKIQIPAPIITLATICNGNTLTISGTNFIGVGGLTIGGSTIVSYNVISKSTILAVIDSGQSGSISISTVAGNATSSDITYIMPPSQTFEIIGNKSPYKGATETYTVSKTNGVNFEWSFPQDWEQKSGSNTNIVTVEVGTLDGIIQVIPSVLCGNWTPISLSVVVYTYVPDDNFQKVLRDLGIDKENKLDSVLTSSLLGVSTLNLDSLNISDLTGIQDFISLNKLECRNNKLKELNLSKNTLLEELYCGNNSLTSIDLSKNVELKNLSCEWNQIKTLDVSQNTRLNLLVCDGIPITSLNLLNNKELTLLSIYSQEIKSIDLSNNTKLTYFSCVDCRLTELDVSKNVNLGLLSCSGNQLASIDISKNPSLTYFGCSDNKLVYLNTKNGSNKILATFYANNNPNLTCINVDSPALASTYSEWKKDAIASYSEYCPPVITSILPKSVCKGGTINIFGANFNDISNISFGGTPAVSFTVLSSKNISAIIENGTSGIVSLTNSLGTAKISGFNLISIPDVAGTITGNALVNQGQSSVAYSVPAILNATSYIWTLPDGATGTSSTNSIKVNYNKTAVSGNITVKGHSDCGDGKESNLSINVNKIPISIAGSDQSVNEGSTVSLDGSMSSDPDGNSFTYKWTAPSRIILSSNTATKPTFIAPEIKNDTILIFSLIVNDGLINSESSTVKVSVKNVIKTGSEILGMNGVKIFPNPSNGIFKIEGLPINQKNKISVSTIDGKLIKKKLSNSTTETIDLSNQVSGTYLLVINKQTFKILKK